MHKTLSKKGPLRQIEIDKTETRKCNVDGHYSNKNNVQT